MPKLEGGKTMSNCKHEIITKNDLSQLEPGFYAPDSEPAKTCLSQRFEEIDRAGDKMVELCTARAKELYGDTLPANVKKRLNAEIAGIIKHGYSLAYMVAQTLVKNANAAGYLVGSRGSVGSSLVAYLLGITDFDPLEFNIPFETFAGPDGEKIPNIVLSFSGDYLSENRADFEKVFEQFDPDAPFAKAYLMRHCDSGDVISLDITKHDGLTMIKRLEGLTGVDAKTIPLDDEKTLHLLMAADTHGVSGFETAFVRHIIEAARPKTFEDFVQVLGCSFSSYVWTKWDDDTGEALVTSEMPDYAEIIVLRDEVMLYLMEQGITREAAYEIMEYVRKGKGSSQELTREHEKVMRNVGVPEWYMESCKKTQYLFPKAHAVSYTIMAFRLAWFKAHYPDAFGSVGEGV